jgi:hypothetical protein
MKGQDYHIQACCALTGEGLEEGLDWLTQKLCQKHKVNKSQGGEVKHVTKLPDHDNRAKLTDLTIEARNQTGADEEEKV